LLRLPEAFKVLVDLSVDLKCLVLEVQIGEMVCIDVALLLKLVLKLNLGLVASLNDLGLFVVEFYIRID
jgi:hypothetical protein